MANNIDIIVRLVDQASKQADKISGSLTKISDAGKQMTKVGGGLTLGLSVPLVAAGSVAVGAASDFEESLAKIGEVFGENAGEIEAWAETAAISMGMSTEEALTAAGTFGNLFASMGVNATDTAEMSTNLTNLAADLASFNNIDDPSIVLEKLRAGMLGQAEPMQVLGVNLTAAAVNAKAAALGLGELGGELSEQDKITARYAIILEQTGLAQDDFSRTSTGLAGQQKILKSQLADVSAELGAVLLPMATEVVSAISRMVQIFSDLSPEMQKTIVYIGAAAVVVGPLIAGIGMLVTGFAAVAPLITALGGALGLLSAPIVVVVALAAALAAVIFNVGGAGDALADTFEKWGLEGIANGIRTVNEKAAILVETLGKLATGEITFGDIETPQWISDLMFWQWPELGVPGWIETLFDWAWPVLGPVGWVVKLMSWAWPVLRKPTWIDNLFSFRWPGFPDAPGWVGGLFGGGDDAAGNNAAGTSFWRGGPTWVGERGPEIVNLPRGAQVIPNHQATAATNITINATVASDIDIEVLANRIAQVNRRRMVMA